MVTFDLEPLESHNQHIKYYNNDRCSTNLNIYSTLHLSHICNVTLVCKRPLRPQWLGCWTVYPEILGANPVKSKNKFC